MNRRTTPLHRPNHRPPANTAPIWRPVALAAACLAGPHATAMAQSAEAVSAADSPAGAATAISTASADPASRMSFSLPSPRLQRRDAKEPLLCWYEEAVKAQWRRPSDIKSNYVHASFCANNRVVFNIAGNRYRLVVEVQYQAGIVWIKFVGTHEQYNRIDVEKVHAH